MNSFLQDLRYALRTLSRAPGFTTVAIVALAIGIGANTAIFTVVHAVLLEPLPFKQPDRLVAIWEETSRRPGHFNTVAPANYLRWVEGTTAFDDLAAFADTRATMSGGSEPVEVVAQLVTSDFFHALGVDAIVGRSFTRAETTNPASNVAVLSYPLWQRRFAGDPAVIGRAVELNGKATTIVGVMPPGFGLLFRHGSLVGRPTDVWQPYVIPQSAREPRGRFLSVIGRLRPGATRAQAHAELRTVMSALSQEFPRFDTGWTADVLPLRQELSGEFRSPLLILFGAVAFVLLIACANVANLLLARGAARQRELAVRAALGAGRIRIVRQLLTEALLLAVAAGITGLLFAKWTAAGLVALSPIDLTPGPLPLNPSVLLFTATVAIATTLLAGTAPAIEASFFDISETLHDGARQPGGGMRARRWRRAFVVAEVALAVVLLIGAGLLLRSLGALRAVNPGFDPSNLLTVRLQLPPAKYPVDGGRTRFFARAVARVGELPGVEAAGAVSFLPFAGLGAATNFSVEGQPPRPPGHDFGTAVEVCDDGYFRAMRIPLERGRWFTERELRERSNVVIVSEELARRYLPGEDPIGKRLQIAMNDPITATEIIGVVGDVNASDLTTPPAPISYWPHPQLAYGAMTLVVRTSRDPLSFAPAVERAIRALDRDQPVSDVRSMQQWLAKSIAAARFTSTLLAIFAAIAALLAVLGLYAVIAYAVSQRTAEIGVRLALGAAAGDVVRMLVADGMRLAGTGLAIGILLAAALGRTLASLLFHTQPTDVVTFVGVVVVFGSVAGVASYVPARRAASIDPSEALRAE